MDQYKRKPRILFVAEAATLAHVVRPIVLAQSLNRNNFDIYFACDSRYLKLFSNLQTRVFWKTNE